MEPIFRLSILDQSPVLQQGKTAEAISETLDLAQLADQMDYHRYWVSEHHNNPFLAGTSPAVLCTRIAAATRRIRVGSGGMLLPNYAPLSVAESFALLATLFPGRIDLGIGRAFGTNAQTASLLNPSSTLDAAAFEQRVTELLCYLKSTGPLLLSPIDLPIWLLGSGIQSAELAAAHNLSYFYAAFINHVDSHAALQRYHNLSANAQSGMALLTCCAETANAAEQMAHALAVMLLLKQKGIWIYPKDAHTYRPTADEGLEIHLIKQRIITGTADHVMDQLERISVEHQTQELMLVTIAATHAARMRSYELIGNAYRKRQDLQSLSASARGLTSITT